MQKQEEESKNSVRQIRYLQTSSENNPNKAKDPEQINLRLNQSPKIKATSKKNVRKSGTPVSPTSKEIIKPGYQRNSNLSFDKNKNQNKNAVSDDT